MWKSPSQKYALGRFAAPHKGQSTPANQTTTVEPPEYIQPFAKDAANAATDIYNQGASPYYPGSTVVPFSDATNQSMQMIQNRAINGSPLEQGAQANAQAVLDGNYLQQGNPYIQGAIDSALEGVNRNYQQNVIPGVNSTFAASGRYGSGAHENAMSMAGQNYLDQAGQVATDMSYNAYDAERGRQQQALALAPQLAGIDYQNAQQLQNVGALQEGQDRAMLQADIDRYGYNQNLDQMALNQYLANLQGAAMNGSVATGPGMQASGGGSPIMGALGGASTGLGMASMLGLSGPVGWGIAGLGALGGLLG